MDRDARPGPAALVPSWLVWGVAAVITALQVADFSNLHGWSGPAAAAIAILAIFFSLTHTSAAQVAVLAATALNALYPQSAVLSLYLTLFWMPFTVATRLGPRTAAISTAAQTVLTIALEASSARLGAVEVVVRSVALLAIFGCSALFGLLLRRYSLIAKRRETELETRNELFRRALSRDLHDTAVHATTSMVMRANQALLREDVDELTRQDLRFIADTGQDATQTLRQTLAALRESDRLPELPSADASWMKARLRANQARLEQAGFQVRLTTELSLTDVAPEILATLGRIVTEVVNNVLRHAEPRSEVSIMIENTGSTLDLMCTNVIGVGEDPDPRRTQLGVVGMTELAETVGGSVMSQAAGGFWLTRITLPT